MGALWHSQDRKSDAFEARAAGLALALALAFANVLEVANRLANAMPALGKDEANEGAQADDADDEDGGCGLGDGGDGDGPGSVCGQ